MTTRENSPYDHLCQIVPDKRPSKKVVNCTIAWVTWLHCRLTVCLASLQKLIAQETLLPSAGGDLAV